MWSLPLRSPGCHAQLHFRDWDCFYQGAQGLQGQGFVVCDLQAELGEGDSSLLRYTARYGV